MPRKLSSLLLLTFVILSHGCAVSCAPFDEEYNCFGGIWDRADRVHGRVGSRFQPAENLEQQSEGDLGQPPPDVPLEAGPETSADWDLD